MNIAVCDDNKEYTNTIENYLDRLKAPKLEYDIYQSGEDIVSAYEENHANYDVIFLDMEMGNLDGIKTANLIRKIDKYVIIVFVTSHKKYMQKSFECTPFRFLIKPLKFEDINRVYKELCIKLKDKPETIIFSENRSKIRIFCDDIVFFESDKHWIIIHTKDGIKYKIRQTITELVNIIDDNTFVRVHRAFVVNLNHIYRINELSLVLHNCQETIPISRTYKKELIDKFLNFKERKYLL